ncbi:MAG: TolC family protein, partial [Pseudomonadota bacterium]
MFWLTTRVLLSHSAAGAAQTTDDVTLDQAIADALAGNPSLAVERREIDIARGVRRQAGIYPFNPELEAEGGA